MSTEPDPLNDIANGEAQLPPELTRLEDRLRNLHQTSPPMLDRDELMFQSGYAAALAKIKSDSATAKQWTSWGWPVLSGTLATVAAVLAVALWLSPDTASPDIVSKGPMSANTTEDSQQRIEANDPDSNTTENSERRLTARHPIDHLIAKHLQTVFGHSESLASTSSITAIRSRWHDGIELEFLPRPQIEAVQASPQPTPLRTNSHRNQELWEQL